MENNKSNPVARKGAKGKNKLKKIITFFTCLVLILVSVFMFIQTTYGIGYKYYENNTIQIGITQQENIVVTTVNDYLNELEENGYYICSSEFNKDIIHKQTVIKKSEINDDELRQNIRNSLEVSVFATKLNIDGDDNTYYFKSENECNKFVNDLKEYKANIKTTSESSIVESTEITSQKALDELLNKYKEEAAAIKKAAEARAKAVVTSRGGSVRKSSKNVSVLSNYVYISSYYGMRNGKMHTGVDFAANQGTNIKAWKAGTVTTASWQGSYGKFIVIDHGDGTVSRYAHCSGYAVSVGDKVSAGQLIGYVGSTGNSTGPHLHFEIKVNGSFVNPLNYL